MVSHYAQSLTFEEALSLYKAVNARSHESGVYSRFAQEGR